MARSESFEEFYTGTVGRLLGQLFVVTGDLHEAEKIVQEAFTRAAARWARLRDYDVPEAWVRRVAMNLAADRVRSLRRHTRAMRTLGPAKEVLPVPVEASPWPGRSGPCRRRRQARPRTRTAGRAAPRPSAPTPPRLSRRT
jgi:DNA-directed RNA polymerase specialized sigma24 family protein